jgi:hypothetical protein
MDTWKGFGEWVKQRPHLASLTVGDALALYQEANPDIVELGAVPEAVLGASAGSVPNMVGD